MFAFDRSADLMLVLVIGGTGYLYGGLIGAMLFSMLQDLFSTITPQYWQFWIGLVLVVIVLVGRERLHRWVLYVPNLVISRWPGAGRRRRAGERRMTIALETQGLEKHFGGLRATSDLSAQDRAGRPPRADRPERRRQDHADQPAHRRAPADRGPHPARRPRHHRSARAQARAARPVAHLPDQPALPDLTPLETIGLAVSERLGHGGDWWRRMGTRSDVNDEIADLLTRFHLLDVMNEQTVTLPYGKQRLLEIAVAIAAKPRVLLLDEPAAGVPESERHDILAVVGALPRDVTVLLIEHDMDLVFSFADRISVLVYGALLTEGPPDADRARPAGQGGLSRRGGGRWLTCSRSTQLRAGYGEAVVLPDMSLRLAEGQVAGAARPQRHRQDHADQLHRRRHPPLRRARRAGRPRHHDACGPSSARAPASAGCRRSATSSARSRWRRT